MEKEIINILNSLLEESKKPNSNIRNVLAKAFMAGQKYQTEKIKKGIDIVFESLDK